jgi:hypothetical protein
LKFSEKPLRKMFVGAFSLQSGSYADLRLAALPEAAPLQ